jgi:lipopolysaccharide biosynthesis protein
MAVPKLIAFYLPQYHPIPENDIWWGKGFTEWRNVVKGRPRFRGHYQPHIPADLGFYDLRLEETRIAQATLAKEYGLTGFCYYHYWFNGKMLLEKPFNDVLESGVPDFPFCFCWANENWTKRWDGMDKDILMEQNYEEYDIEKHFNWLERAFSDKRYIKINGKPLFLIYNTIGIPNIQDKITTWKKLAIDRGFPGMYIASVKSLRNKLTDFEIMDLGFDSLVEFIPGGEESIPVKISSLPRQYINAIINKIIILMGLQKKIKLLPRTFVFDYKSMVSKIIERKPSKYKTFPCVLPGWDNSARKQDSAVLQNDDEILYGKFLESSFEKVQAYPEDEQIVFINAWNEWAEGCHLEPDLRNGKKFLEATLNAVKKQSLINPSDELI